jgi:hypothetical protein
MKVDISHVFVMGWCMVLGEVISIVICARLPMEAELSLADAVSAQ